MKGKVLLILLVLIIIPFLFSEEKKKPEVQVSLGTKVNSIENYPGKIGEFEPLNKGLSPVVSAQISGSSGKLFYGLQSIVNENMKDQRHELILDFGRIFEENLQFNSLPHRLDHDPLKNLDVTSLARSGVFHTDFDPTKEYRINRKELVSKSVIRVPSIPFAHLYVNYRDERREGEYQARTLSKCATCHIVAKSRPIDNFNRSTQFGGNLKVWKGSIDYSYTKTDFKERGETPTNVYLPALHPYLVVDNFTSRIQYDADNGPLPFDQIPDTRKGTHIVKGNFSASESTTFIANYVNSKIENLFTNLSSKADAFAGGFSTKIGKNIYLNAKLNYRNIESDSIFVDVVELRDNAGPNKGKTYAEAYPDFGSPDYLRKSSFSREVWEFSANARFKFSKKLGFRAGYEYEKIDRKNFEVSVTESNTLKGEIEYKPLKNLDFKLNTTYTKVSNPFANLYAAISPAVQLYAVADPFKGLQFYHYHRLRQAHLSSLPSKILEGRGFLSWSPTQRFSISGSMNLRDEKNNLNYSEWMRKSGLYNINIWLAPADKLNLTLSYNFHNESLQTLFAIPVAEGCGGGIIGGHTGSLYDPVDYNIKINTAFLTANYILSERLNLYTNISYNSSFAKLSDLSLDTSQVPYIPALPPAPFNYDFSDVPDYSDLKVNQFLGEIGFLFEISKSWSVKGSFLYHPYKDLAPYLFDTEGKAYSIFFGFIWNL
jgi:hypothetical protein